MNANVITVPSVLGISDCIEERVNFDASLAQVVGSTARWASFESRYQSGIVTGSAFLTPDNERQLERGRKVVINLHSALLEGIVVETADRADARGRVVMSYKVIMTRTRYLLPHKDKVVLLYVPKWQIPSTLLHDWIADEDITVTGTWTDGALVSGEGMWKRHLTHTITIPTCTVLVDKDMNATPTQTGWGSCGLILAHAEPVNTSSPMSILYESWYDNVRYLRIANQNITNPTFSGSGWSHVRVANYEADYDGITYHVGNMRPITWVAINRTSVPLWSKIRCIAVWSVRLTDEEIEQAKTYFDNVSEALDFTR